MKLRIWKLRRTLGLTWDTARVPWWTLKSGHLLADTILAEKEFQSESSAWFFLYHLMGQVMGWQCMALFLFLDVVLAPLQYHLARRWKRQKQIAEATAAQLRKSSEPLECPPGATCQTCMYSSVVDARGIRVGPGQLVCLSSSAGFRTIVRNNGTCVLYVGC